MAAIKEEPGGAAALEVESKSASGEVESVEVVVGGIDDAAK